jgi:hypothetical protein
MTVRDTLSGAVSMTGARTLGSPASDLELATALVAFQNMLLSLPRTTLVDVLISANYTAGENERITDSSGTAVITRPTTLVDPITGETRTPLNGAVVEVTNTTTPTRHIYISELKGWQQVNGLALEGTQPFGPEHEEGLRAMTAIRIAPLLQKEVPQWVAAMATQGRQMIRQRFRQPYTATTDPALLSYGQRTGLHQL